MSKSFWKDLSENWPISALAPMDGYTDSAYRQVIKEIAPKTICFSEFYSADGLVHSKRLAESALKHEASEKPLIIQIFGKDPVMFREAAIMIEQAGAAGVDVNMGCPARKVVRSGHGSSLMINTDTAFRIIEEMSKAVSIPVSVKTRLGWDNWETHLIDFCKWLENAGANLISVHGRTYQQAFDGKADWNGIYELKKHLSIPVIGNGDVMDYDDGMRKIYPNKNFEGMDEIRVRSEPRNKTYVSGTANEEWSSKHEVRHSLGVLDGFMIGRASFGNPWAFLPGRYSPTLREILRIMHRHGDLLVDTKDRKWVLESRKHLVQYLHGFPGVKEYRKSLVTVETREDIHAILDRIEAENGHLLDSTLSEREDEMKKAWGEVSEGCEY